MRFKPSFALFLAAAAVLPAAVATAADYEPPVFADEAPEYAPVEVGSGWYLRGDAAYHFDDGYGYDEDYVNYAVGATPYDRSEKENQFSGSVGIGYHWADWLRTDVNLGLFGGNEADMSYDDGDVRIEGGVENNAWYGMANVYADLGTVAGFTPYVGAGVGVLRTKWDAGGSYENDNTQVSLRFEDNQRDYNLAYTLNAGVAYNLGGNVALDVGYQYFNSPEAEYVRLADYNAYPKSEGLEFHQIRAGLRYDIW